MNLSSAQTSLAGPFTLNGVGVHGGRPARLTARPAREDYGIRFQRVDIPGASPIPALYDRVCDTRLCTIIGASPAQGVSTIEHIMAALAGCGVDNALIEVNGPEVPIMDGSAAPFVSAIMRAGLVELDAPLRAIRILEPVEAMEGDKRAALVPAPAFGLDFTIDFKAPAIGRQQMGGAMSGKAFARGFSDCRTFGLLAEVEQLRAMGFARGGSLDNAIVVDHDRVLNPGGLRREDEFVRHKILDAVGDLALAGAPIIGWYQGHKSGHDMTSKLLHALFARPEAWRYETVRDRAALLPLALAPLRADAPVCA